MGHSFIKSIRRPSRKAFLVFWSLALAMATVLSLVPVGIPTGAAETPVLFLAADGVETSDVYMTTRQRVELTVPGAPEGARYQWQILHPESDDTWVNIYDGVRPELSVTIALAENVLRPDGTTGLRCRITEGDSVLFSQSVTVHFSDPQAQPSPVLSRPNTLSGAVGDGIPEFVTVTIEYIRYDFARDDNGQLIPDGSGGYMLESSGQAFLPYIATLQGGSPIDTVVPNPTMVGYDSYHNGSVTANVTLKDDSVTEDTVYTVEYRPALVPYSVRYFLQNIYDDMYVEDITVAPEFQGTGYTGSVPTPVDGVDPLNKPLEGFTTLYHQPDSIAADGSTLFEVYYERNYYLMEFDCNGGYGTETLYIRYGSYISVPQPIKPGWVFGGWDLVKTEDPANTTPLSDGQPNTLPEQMPACNTGYKAIWNTTNTTYTVVYWRENADDDGYSYWGSDQRNATSNTYVDGQDDVPTTVTITVVNGKNLDEKPYFTYNDPLTDKHVLVEGDGSTVVNVYYTRNKYTISFELRNNYGNVNFNAPATHVHQEGVCYGVLDCDLGHTHDDSCNPQLICTIPPHTHSEECCNLVEHAHTNACCTLGDHTHTVSCYKVSSGKLSPQPETDFDTLEEIQDGTKSDNGIVRIGERFNHSYYYQIGSTWYQITDIDVWDWESVTVTLNCNLHVHGTGCQYGANDCPVYEHAHDTGDCSCAQEEHTHSESCYTYSCGVPAHTHTSDCYTVCNRPESQIVTIGGTRYYQITAKYEQTIGDIWPTAAHFPDITFRGWEIDGVGSTAVSKRINMTQDLCDTSDGIKNAQMETGGSKNYLYYMFESFDQSSPANGNDRILRNGVYYDKSELYYQEVNSGGNWNQKEIAGMAPVNNGVSSSNSNIFLYYTRNRHTLSFHNVNQSVASISEIMFEKPLKDLTLGNGTSVPNYTPPYPTTYEPGAYEFKGWYTTPQCFDGTEVKWDTITMPDSDLTLYAKWTPILRNVVFYNTYDDMVNNADPFLEAKDVPHGELLGSAYNEQPDAREGYRFIGWFYMDDEGKKRFAPDSMEITRDLKLFAEWTTSIDTTYQVEYVLDADVNVGDKSYPAGTPIADMDFNHITVGKTKTFQAKGGTQLDEAFRTSYFPTTNSHSILMKEDADDNTFQFRYVYDPEVYYKVRYLDKVTNTELRPSVVLKTNKAVVTEKFLPIQGYRPTAYYVTKALKSDGLDGTQDSVPADNVLTFYYIQDTEHGMFSIEHYLENPDSTDSSNKDNYTLYEYQTGTADVNTEKTGTPRSYQGFAHSSDLDTVIFYEVSGDEDNPVYKEVETTGSLSGTVTYMGLSIRIYYSRLDYPYIIEYREYGAAADAEPLWTNEVDGAYPSAKFDATVHHTAPETYELEDGSGNTVVYEYSIPDADKEERTKSLTIRVAEDGKENPNKLIFYYSQKKIPVHYHTVCTEETGDVKYGAVSMASESAASAANLGGCTATPASGFIFKGWFHDEACTKPLGSGGYQDENTWVTGTTLKPGVFKLEDGAEEDHYYALFEPVTRSLTIKKEGAQDGDNFLFRVSGTNSLKQEVSLTVSIQGNGQVTVDGLYCGDYTVTELSGWSWTYTPENAEQTVALTVDNEDTQELIFKNTYTEPYWLTDETRKDNKFSS